MVFRNALIAFGKCSHLSGATKDPSGVRQYGYRLYINLWLVEFRFTWLGRLKSEYK